MNNYDNIKIKGLSDCSVSYISPFLARFEYPWEMIGEIKAYTEELISKGIEGFHKYSENVLVGENVSIAPTATIIGPAVIGRDSEIRPGAYIRGERKFGCSFADAYDRLRSALSAKEDAVVIHLQGFFIRGNIDAERQSVAEKYGDRFIMLGDIRTDEATHGEFNHPNDLGMEKIAECLIPALRECGLR